MMRAVSFSYVVHLDHLGTPQAITDSSQATVWQADYSPFGEATITTETITNNLRFPGQLYDEETGLHYNYKRDYDPGLGRYLQSDPIGLNGGFNTYLYVNANPLRFVDPLGLYIPYWHSLFTELGAANSGLSPQEGAELADAVVNVDDSDVNPGTQGIGSAHMHAMCSKGLSPEACASIYAAYIDRLMKKCTMDALAKAIHAIQDSYSRSHRNFQPYGSLLSLIFTPHVYYDTFPTSAELADVPRATRNLINKFRKNCECNK